jgi:hypothetical protein
MNFNRKRARQDKNIVVDATKIPRPINAPAFSEPQVNEREFGRMIWDALSLMREMRAYAIRFREKYPESEAGKRGPSICDNARMDIQDLHAAFEKEFPELNDGEI